MQELDSIMIEPIVSFDKFDVNNVLVDRAGVEEHIPQRFEMAQLDGVLYLDADTMTAVGYKDVTEDEFWVRGHMPGFPLMPGVIICESTAQLVAYMASLYDIKGGGIVGFGGIDKVKFRGMVVPGDKLIVMARKKRLRKNVMVICEIQGYVEDRLVVDGEIKGVVLPATATQ